MNGVWNRKNSTPCPTLHSLSTRFGPCPSNFNGKIWTRAPRGTPSTVPSPLPASQNAIGWKRGPWFLFLSVTLWPHFQPLHMHAPTLELEDLASRSIPFAAAAAWITIFTMNFTLWTLQNHTKSSFNCYVGKLYPFYGYTHFEQDLV